ncbi:ATP-binding protein [Halalkalibaculum sp. DA3122]|uniref:ATP-binding protein n=1 Tax=unclassified Halalkalibaculum TaxID=2964617 RepID=UPI003754794B
MDFSKELNKLESKGILRSELYLGSISSVSATEVRVNLYDAGKPSGSFFEGSRYGKGEVGEFLLIEGQQNLLLGRMIEVRLPERERRNIDKTLTGSPDLDAIGIIQLLGTVTTDKMRISAGLETYPRLGDKVYSAPHTFISLIPSLMEDQLKSENDVRLKIGAIEANTQSNVSITPEKLFGRHCAILGATGGGKSWTTAHIIEECLKFDSKIILLDATGEYRDFSHDSIRHLYLGEPVNKADNAIKCSLPPSNFAESDFIAMFRPSSGIQMPKLREAIISLRIVHEDPSLADANGYFVKTGRTYEEYNEILSRSDISKVAYNPNAKFDVNKLIGQIENECVWENDESYGRKNQQHWGYCSTLVSRIGNILNSNEFDFIFSTDNLPSLNKKIDHFLNDQNGQSNQKLLRISLSGVSEEYQAKEIVANVIGRKLLTEARKKCFVEKPLVVFVDEAHNFLGGTLGRDENSADLDSFELIAKEGRKYGLNICLVTQRPRDITKAVLSQMGTLIVHRLTNDQDRYIVEKASGEIDKSASSFLPNLKPGEAAIIGIDFPIPLSMQIIPPNTRPLSEGPNFQKFWNRITNT